MIHKMFEIVLLHAVLYYFNNKIDFSLIIWFKDYMSYWGSKNTLEISTDYSAWIVTTTHNSNRTNKIPSFHSKTNTVQLQYFQ